MENLFFSFDLSGLNSNLADRQECLSYRRFRNVQIAETFFRWQPDEDGAGDP